MVVISTIDFNPAGSLVLQEDAAKSDLRSVSRRLSRSATLDGGAVLDDAGFSDGDRTINLSLSEVTGDQYSTLRDMATLFSGHLIATVDGVFSGGIDSLQAAQGETTLRFLVESKVSA